MNHSPQMPAMEAVVNVLESDGVDTVFGIPGAAILPFYKATIGSPIRHITVRHEEGGTHAADGCSRATGRIGVCAGTSGPAGTNMVTGLYTAMADSVPIFTITGQVPVDQLDREGFQAVDIAEIVRPVVEKSYLVSQAGQLPWVYREAFRIMREGRPGPVHIDLRSTSSKSSSPTTRRPTGRCRSCARLRTRRRSSGRSTFCSKPNARC